MSSEILGIGLCGKSLTDLERRILRVEQLAVSPEECLVDQLAAVRAACASVRHLRRPCGESLCGGRRARK